MTANANVPFPPEIFPSSEPCCRRLNHRSASFRRTSIVSYQLDLFARCLDLEDQYGGIFCEVIPSPRISGRNRTTRVSGLSAVDVSTECPPVLCHGMPNSVTQISDYAPRSKTRYLDRNFMSWVCRIRGLRKLSYELSKLGKTCLGDVVRMTEEEICRATSAKKKTIILLKSDLAGVGLRLGMKTPFWKHNSSRDTHFQCG
jgi:hypothetical protein